MGISICVSIKNRSIIQDEGKDSIIFPNTLDSIAELVGDIELVVVDFKSTDVDMSELLAKYSSIDTKLVELDEDFSRGKGLNTAVFNSKYDNILLSDADILIKQGAIEELEKSVANNTLWFPCVTRLDSAGREYFVPQEGTGICGLTKTQFKSVNGLPEFYSWGGEDCIFNHKLSNKWKKIRNRTANLIHQWHPPKVSHENHKYRAGHCFNNYSGRN